MSQKYTDDGVKRERSGWRDLEFSDRHRLWGFDCPMVDIDFLVVEYDRSTAKALIEYKHWLAANPQLAESNYATLRKMADSLGIPFFVVKYWKDPYRFAVMPANMNGGCYLQQVTEMTELEYVTWLYKLRGRALPKKVHHILNNGAGRP